jgi:hypothetical protein
MQLWEGAIWLEETAGGEGWEDRVLALYERAIGAAGAGGAGRQANGHAEDGVGSKPAAAAGASKALTPDEAREFSLRSVQFADMCCEAAQAAAVEARHAARFMLQGDSRKRSFAAANVGSVSEQAAKQARLRAVEAATAAVNAAVEAGPPAAADATTAAAAGAAGVPAAAGAAAAYHDPAAAAAYYGQAAYGSYGYGYGHGYQGYGYGGYY